MIIQYLNGIMLNMKLDDTTTSVYQLIFDKNDSNDTKIIQYFTMHGLWLCIKLDGFYNKWSMQGLLVIIQKYQ